MRTATFVLLVLATMCMFAGEVCSEEAWVAKADDIVKALVRGEPKENITSRWNALVKDMELKNIEVQKGILYYIYSKAVVEIREQKGDVPEGQDEGEIERVVHEKKTPEEMLNDICEKVYEMLKRTYQKEEERKDVWD
jgi:hypothetical protein